MNHVDIIIAIPLAIGAIHGFYKGFVLEISSLVGVVLGVYIAAKFAAVVGGFIAQYFDWNQHAIQIVSFILIFVAVIIVVQLIARVIEKLFKIAGLSFLNRLAGLVAGTLKIAFILSVFLILFNYVNRDEIFMSEETRNNSFLYNKVAALVPSLLPGYNLEIPDDARESIRNVRTV